MSFGSLTLILPSLSRLGVTAVASWLIGMQDVFLKYFEQGQLFALGRRFKLFKGFADSILNVYLALVFLHNEVES